LERAGYTTIIQSWDLHPGSNFVLEMDRAVSGAERTIALLSPDYLAARYPQSEWSAAFANDKLLPVRVRECEIKGVLAPIAYIDLVGLTEIAATGALLEGARHGRAKPATAPRFPTAAAQAPHFPGALPGIWNVPHLRNPNFTGREQLLRELRASLTSGRTAAIVPIAGLGGAGKTQLALEYAYRHTADYEIVWWVRAEDPATLTADYALLATELGLPEKDLADQQATAAAVRSWLGHNPNWLLILDNARSAADCRGHLPMGAAGHVLITSRDPNWGSVAKPLKLPVLPRPEAVEFLQKRCGRDEPAAAGELCDALGDLPLALDLVGAYIEETGGSIAEYLELYRSRPRELLTDTVAATWEISFERLQTEAPLAPELLYLVAFLAPDDIDPKLVSPGFTDAMQFDRARVALRRYSLIDVTGGSIAVHRLVQAVTRDRLAREGQEQKWAETALELVNSAFPFELNVVETWSPSARLLPQALAAAGHCERLAAAGEPTQHLLNGTGLYLYNRGQLEEAERVLKRALAIAENVYGPDHPDVAAIANNIGANLKAHGDPAGALQYIERALAIGEKAHGPDHPNVATLANNIGLILKEQGDLAGALQYTRRALAIGEKVFGPDHPQVAIFANNIGTILQDQGDRAGALQYTQRALAIDEKAYGPDHPTVATFANNIGQILNDQGDLAGALQYAHRALAIDKKVYGPDHPEVATDAKNIGRILHDQGDLAGALRYIQRALRIRQAALGPDNPATKRASRTLAIIEQALAKAHLPPKTKRRIRGRRQHYPIDDSRSGCRSFLCTIKVIL
jgi:tetratricopeptide (TPR) repeat protein